MELLILGDSNSEGGLNAGRGWPEIVRESLEQKLGEPVTLRNSRLWVDGPGATVYLEKRIAESKPDIVVVTVGSFPFTAKYVYLRMMNLFGQRVGAWYKNIEIGFDKGTAGKPAGGDRVNKVMRKVVRRVVGTASFTSRENVTAGYKAVFASLARHEDVDVIAMSYPGASVNTRSPEAKRERAKFFPEVRAAVEGHRFAWIDGPAIFAGIQDIGRLQMDGLHYTDEGQQVFARAMEEAILERISLDGQRQPKTG